MRHGLGLPTQMEVVFYDVTGKNGIWVLKSIAAGKPQTKRVLVERSLEVQCGGRWQSSSACAQQDECTLRIALTDTFQRQQWLACCSCASAAVHNKSEGV